MEHTFDIDQIIAKRLTEEINARENAFLEKWLSESTDNRLYFKQMERLWQEAQHGTVLPKPLDVDAALLRTKNKIRQQEPRGRIIRFNAWWIAAAAAMTLLVSAVWFFQSGSKDTQVLLSATEKPLNDTLSDGSRVSLNRYSSLSASFSQHQRRVKMQGEAYFQVAHDPQKPFVIDVRQVQVTVIGTRFNIDNNSDSTKVLVSVEEGKVKVQSGGETIYLLAGEQVSIDCQSGRLQRSTLPASGNISGWIDRRFVFDDVPLSEVLPLLQKSYGVRIELKNKELGKCRLHTHFNDESIEQVVSVIAETFSLQIENKNGRYFLDGPACNQ